MKRGRRDPTEVLPLTAAEYNVLVVLGRGETHGYGIMRDVFKLSAGETILGPSTLYGTLKRMLDRGLIEESDERPDPELDDERRRYFRLTGFGQRVAAAETERLERLTTRARSYRGWWSKPGMEGG